VGAVSKADRLLLALLAMSLIANLGLFALWQHSRDGATIFEKNRSQVVDRLPTEGAQLADLQLATIDGVTSTTDFSHNSLPILVYVLSPTCGWCARNRPDIDFLASQLKGRYRVIGISTTATGLSEYVSENASPFPIFYVKSRSPHSTITLSGTPETLVFSKEGQFVRGWSGAYIGDTKIQVSGYFGVKLPI
jgi:hypothetical protein